MIYTTLQDRIQHTFDKIKNPKDLNNDNCVNGEEFEEWLVNNRLSDEEIKKLKLEEE